MMMNANDEVPLCNFLLPAVNFSIVRAVVLPSTQFPNMPSLCSEGVYVLFLKDILNFNISYFPGHCGTYAQSRGRKLKWKV
jgi:hypothetical protein